MLTRLGVAGVDAFTIMRVAGHSSVKVSERYVHASAESLERAIEKLEAFNKGTRYAIRKKKATEQSAPATISATPKDLTPVSPQQTSLSQ